MVLEGPVLQLGSIKYAIVGTAEGTLQCIIHLIVLIVKSLKLLFKVFTHKMLLAFSWTF